MPSASIQVYQAEWCPFSGLVRQALTELGQPFIAVPVPVEPDQRTYMLEATGTDLIPTVVLEDGTILGGDAKEIVAELGRRFPVGPDAEAHRRAAETHGLAPAY